MMYASNLHNYLRAFRKRLGFTLVEIGELLGGLSESEVSRYERFRNVPTLKSAIAYEIITGVPIRKLFSGLYDEVQRQVEDRAKSLAVQISHRPATPERNAKLESLKSILYPEHHEQTSIQETE